MKSVLLYVGTSSNGNDYELVLFNGNYYSRSKVFNKYGLTWDNWEKINNFTGTFYEDQYGKKRLKWGWGVDAIYLGECKRKINL